AAHCTPSWGDPMPVDLSTLAILAGLFFTAVIGDAALFGDPVQLHITVPAKLEEAGFTEEAAEQLFVAEVARIAHADSIVRTPRGQISSPPSVLAPLAKPLQLDNVVVSLQSQVGIDVITIHGAVMTDAAGNGLNMVIFVNQPPELPTKIELKQADGDPNALVVRGSRLALELISPYRVALTDFAEGLHGDAGAVARARDTALRALARPWVPSRATERVMLRNLLAILALLDGDLAGAETQFAYTDTVPEPEPAALGTVAFNRAFVAVAKKQPAQALSYFKRGRQLSIDVDLPGYAARIDMLGGLVAWSLGDMAQAERLMRKA